MWVYLLYLGAGIFALYVYTRLTLGITRSATCLIGKTAIVTGANSGMGYEVTLNLASRGCKVIMADVADMEESKINVIKHTNNHNIVTKKLDLSSLESVRNFAAEVNKTEERLDILVNNAGIGASAENRTKDGLHPLMQINYFGHFLLTHLLIGLLKKSAPSRIVFTVSALSFTNNLTRDNLNFDMDKSSLPHPLIHICTYANSKLAMIVAADKFAEKLKGTGVTANSVHPGLVSTPIFVKSNDVMKSFPLQMFVRFAVSFFSKSSWEGSQGMIRAAVSKSMEDVSGVYLSDCTSWYKPPSAYNKKFCQEIWEESEKFVGLKEEEKL